jgi:two-component sensor histidine kinase
MVAVLFGLGVFEYSFFTRHAIFLGALVETLVFQALIVTRYETSRKNELALKNDMIALQLEANKALESKVEERTKKLSAMLVERELLLKEVHHRVKNNFHSLIALLWMDDEKNGSHRNTEMINHLKALSDVHEQLCAMEDLQRIDLKKYIHKIIDNLQIAFDDPINFNQNIVSTSVVLDIAMAIGVIVNEIVTNAVKHSESTKKLIVTLSLKESDGFIYLEIDDNNPGTIQEESKGFGIGLVQQFASLLPNATFAFKEHGFKLKFSKEQQ